MTFYAKIENEDQIKSLSGLNIKDGLKFFYSLFFKSDNPSRRYLINTSRCVLYCNDGVVCCGNLDNIPPYWEGMGYDEFVSSITACC